jgi:iron complex transport system substrate-binding protein
MLVMLCGFGVERAIRDLDALSDPAARRVLEAVPAWALDGNAYTSRPGPRIVDGAERIRAALEGREMPGLRRWQPAHVA